jgi:hypothetical protein
MADERTEHDRRSAQGQVGSSRRIRLPAVKIDHLALVLAESAPIAITRQISFTRTP